MTCAAAWVAIPPAYQSIAHALLAFEQPLIWLLLWSAPSLYALAEGDGWKGLYWINFKELICEQRGH